MDLTYTEWKRFDRRLKRMDRKLDQILTNQGTIMATGAQLVQNLADIKALVKQLFDLFVARDAEVVQLKADLAAAVQRANLSDAEKAALQADVDAAFASSEDTENDLRAKVPGVPPIGGTPLLPSYADRASFDTAVAAYTGPEAVTVDGSQVKAGSTPSIDYFTHSATGEVNTSGPTD